MSQDEQVDVLIVGSGPAGSSTALHLVKSNPEWAGRITVVDKAIHPREKLCGGGITHLGQRVLSGLGLSIEVPSFQVREAKIVYKGYSYSIRGNPIFVVIRRDEFDHWLVQKVEEKGVQVRQGEKVLNVQAHDDFIEVTTEKAVIRAKVLVGADGSGSIVRRKLKWDDESRVARMLEILTPERPQEQVEFRDKIAVFDFTPMNEGMQGYYWDFPSYVQGAPYMNRGVFDSRSRPEFPKVNLKHELSQCLLDRQRNLDDYKLKGHPLRWFDSQGRFSMHRVLLAGDAAGADSFVGEGIPFALAYGDAAAASIANAFEQNDFSFSDYRKHISEHHVLGQLSFRTRLARLAYRLGRYDWIARLGWRMANFGIRFTPWHDADYNPVEARKLVTNPKPKRTDGHKATNMIP
jgi:geranylgeranyl reductase family protein